MYVDALQKGNIIHVVERVNGQRIYKEYPADYHFYVTDPSGTHRSIFGDSVKRYNPRDSAERMKLTRAYPHGSTWEIDCNPVLRCLEQNYLYKPSPKLHTAFFDIETDLHPELGYCTPEEASNPITSISVYLNWLDQMVCIAVPPKTLSWEAANEIADSVPDVILVETEAEMLDMFLTLIEDADVLSGWNSQFYDLPFIHNRILKVLDSHETRRLCLWDEKPKQNTQEVGGKKELVYELKGRAHLDYMLLYKKYTFEERQSFSLDNISKEELGAQKVPYEGTLDHLYKYDFKLFLEYNIQDTNLLNELDKKLKYIDLACKMAHDVPVTIPMTQGSVGITEQAIVVEAHKMGKVVPNKKLKSLLEGKDNRAAGGWVSNPKKGLHKWLGSSDLNSLYPSVIRTLNSSPETLVGQVLFDKTDATIKEWEGRGKKFADWWNDRFSTLEMENYFTNDKSNVLTLQMESGDTYQVTGAELRQLVFESGNPWCISANGTIFRTDVEGVIPALMARWFKERKELQAIKKGYVELLVNEKEKGIQIPVGVFTDADIDNTVKTANPFVQTSALDVKKLVKMIAENDTGLVEYMNTHKLMSVNGKVQYSDQAELHEVIEHWDTVQNLKKRLLNSLYGGLLNEHHRFFDKRMGQSITLTGRNITRHMTSETNRIFTGVYDHEGITAVYNDTDSILGNSIIQTSSGELSVESLFEGCDTFYETDGKEYGIDENVMVMSYDRSGDVPYMGHVNYVYRHKVSKQLYEIEDSMGNVVTVTEDHSVMVDRNGDLVECKPMDIEEGDVILTLNMCQ